MRLFIRQFGLCYWCGVPVSLMRRHRTGNLNVYATLDHLKKKEDGGTLYHTNVVLAHGKCNSTRHSGQMAAHIAAMKRKAPMLAKELEFGELPSTKGTEKNGTGYDEG